MLGLPEQFVEAGDAVLLIHPVGVCGDDARDELLAMLAERSFLRSAREVERLVPALEAMAAGSGLGCEVSLDQAEGEDLLGELRCAALVTTRGHAHLALATGVERGRKFVAHAIGRVCEGVVVVRVNGVEVLRASGDGPALYTS